MDNYSANPSLSPPGVARVTDLSTRDVVVSSGSGVSWGAIFAGAAGAAALSLVLLLLGTGLGLSAASPWASRGASAAALGFASILWLSFTQIAASGMGGYLAGQLRTKWAGAHTDEVYFRDTAHGFLAWAMASVVGAILLAAPATSLIGGATSGAVQAASYSQATDPMDGYVDTLIRPNNPTAENTANSGDTRRELTRLLTADFRNGGEPSVADRSYVAKVVAARTGLSPADAEKRVNDVVVQIKADLDKARKAAMKLAIWLTLSLFIGAFSAALAATEGGGLRDGTWGKRALRR